MPTESIQPCNVCEKPLNGRALDVHLGPVCMECKTQLRWAHAWLTKDINGIKDCTNNHYHRLKK